MNEGVAPGEQTPSQSLNPVRGDHMWEIRSFRTGTNHPTSHWHWEISGGIIPEILHVPPRTSRTSHLPLVSNTTVSSSSHDCHSIILDVSDTAWMFGRNERALLGVAGREYISENARSKLLALPKTRFVYAACCRNHSLLVGSGGRAWLTGANSLDNADIHPTRNF